MKLVVPTLEDCEKVRLWRNENLESLRTPYQLTHEMQADFYRDVICNRKSPHRYWSIKDNFCIGFGGLTFIEWENRLARISLILDPTVRGKGFGEKAVDLILDKAFNYLNLQTVCGECYECNKAGMSFWVGAIMDKYDLFSAELLNRKYWNGKYYNSLYFSIDRNDYVK